MAPRRSYTSLPKRTTLTYKQRLQVCEYARNNPSLRAPALADWATREFRLPKEPSESSIRKICADEAKWLDALAGAGDESMRKKSHVQAPEVEAALLEWIAKHPGGTRDNRIKGRVIQEKADELASTLGYSDEKRPKFSKGWLSGFEERYKINGKGSNAGQGKTSAGPSSRKRPSLSDPIPTRIVLTYKQRHELCEHAARNAALNNTQLAAWATEKFHLRKYISNHAVSRILKRADEWKSVPSREAKHMRHARPLAAPEVDALVANWVTKKRERGVKVTGNDITAKARAVADELELPEDVLPKFSKGWLQSFMTRHKFTKPRNASKRPIQPSTGADEASDADYNDADEYDDDVGSAEDEAAYDGSHGQYYQYHYEEQHYHQQQDVAPARKKSRVEHLLN